MSITRSVAGISLLALALAACSTDPEKAKVEFLESGRQYMKDGQVNEAILQFRNAIQQDARYGDARLELAKALRDNGDVRGALGEFVRAADLLPESTEAQIMAGRSSLAVARFDDARSRADKALAIDPQSVDALILKGSALSGLRQFDEAVTEVESAIALDPTRAESYGTLALVQVAQGNRPEAEAAFKKAVEVAPTAPEPRVALSGFFLATGQVAASEATLNDGLKVAPEDVLLNRALAALYMRTGQAQKAEAPLRLIADRTQDAAALVALGDYYRATQRDEDALKAFERAAADAKTFSAATVRRAAIFHARGQIDQSYAELDRVLAKSSSDITALSLKAQYQMVDGRLDDALSTARTLVEASPTAFQAQYVLGRVLQRRGSIEEATAAYLEALRFRPRHASTQLELARLALASNRPQDALKYAQDVVNALPNDPAAALVLARAQVAAGSVATAERTLRDMAARYPNVAVVHAQLGSLFMAKRDSRAARASFERAVAIDSTSLEALTGLVGLDMQERRPEAALARADQALAKQPNSTGLLMLSARAHAGAGDSAKAEAQLRKVIELDAGNMSAYGALAGLYIGQRRLDEAIGEYEKVVLRTPKAAGPHTLIGMLLEAQGKTEEARKRYELVLTLDPNAPVASNNLAWILVERGENLDQALQLAQTAKQRLPDNVDVTDTLGWAYFKKGLYPQAITALKEAVDKQPANSSFAFHLGLAYARNGDEALARERLQAALKASPSAPWADEAKAALSQLAGS